MPHRDQGQHLHIFDPSHPDLPNIMQKTARKRPSGTVQNPLETYLKEINETALLTADQEKDLARRIAKGDLSGRAVEIFE